MTDETRAFYPVNEAETALMQPLGDPDIDFAKPQETDTRAGLLDRLGLPRPQWSMPRVNTPRWLWQPTWRRRWLRWLAVLAVLYIVSVLLHNAAAGYTAVAAIALWLFAWFKGRRYEVQVPPSSAVTVVFDQKTGQGRFADLDEALEAGGMAKTTYDENGKAVRTGCYTVALTPLADTGDVEARVFAPSQYRLADLEKNEERVRRCLNVKDLFDFHIDRSSGQFVFTMTTADRPDAEVATESWTNV
ncbi:hypothetical protein HMPREF2860_01400 [Corynebacterium sp. HMSC064E10]|uniref:hypothetical protein n=1 Tax=Corynebacterium sp. HMSC064E10 TaxID=1739364 RepID=UPI0008A38FEC|nr:hypothetical protein [Corynebacterium sp. HMSC064E10]OFR93342.1 hypothetical protein HMPREF2860_01400 [Corynebacterium sp. HMSC064E10]